MTTVMLIHGGGGPPTVAGLATSLRQHHDVLTPTLPGWSGTTRAGELARVGDFAGPLLESVRQGGHRDVVVVGSSLGGWVAAEMVLADAERLISGLVLIDSAGVEVPGEPMRDFFALDARGVAEYSFHDAQRFYVDPATLPAEVLAGRQANLATMKQVAGDPYMHDPTLLGRLGEVGVPTMVLWGEADRIFTPDYGRALAAAIPGSTFTVIPRAGHLPQIEQPEATHELVQAFVGAVC